MQIPDFPNFKQEFPDLHSKKDAFVKHKKKIREPVFHP